MTAASRAFWKSRRGARSSPTRSTPASTCSSPRSSTTWSRARTTTSRRISFRCMLRDGKRLGGYVIVGLLEPTSATCSSTSKPTTTRSRARCDVEIAGTQIGAHGVWAGDELPRSTRAPRSQGPSLRQRRDDRSAAPQIEELRRRIGDGSIVAAGARVHRAVLWEDVYVGERRDAHRLHARGSHDRQGPRDDRRRRGDRSQRCTIGSGGDRPSNIKLWPDKIGELGLDRLDVADLRHQVARFALRRRSASPVLPTSRSRRSSRSSSAKRSARVCARAKRDDQPRRASRRRAS